MPCDNGDGRVRRGVVDPLLLAVVVEAMAEVVEIEEVGGEGESVPGRIEVAVEVEEVEEFR